MICCKSEGSYVGECKTECIEVNDKNIEITGDVVKKTDSGSTSILLIGLLVLILAAGGFYYFKYVKNPTGTVVPSDKIEDAESKKFCENCGANINEDDSFCTGCGDNIQKTT